MNRIIVYLFFWILTSCSKPGLKEESHSASSPKGAPVINVDANNVVRTLTGTEVGINLNYLMDDSYLPGQTYQGLAASLQKTGVKLLRYPGGEKSDNYLFRKAPYTSAITSAAYCNFPATDPRFYNTDLSAKSAVLDFDEYMSVCRQVNATPFVVIGYDAMYSTSNCGTKPTRSQLLTNAREWVRYANITKRYNVKYWMIGNESWNDANYNGRVSAAVYAADLEQFADSMRSIDPTIKIIANGRSNDNWWKTVLESNAAAKIDYLAVSNYLPQGFTGYNYYKTFTGDLNIEVTATEYALNNYASANDKSRIGIIVSEYNSIDFFNSGWPNENDLGHALCNFQMLADALIRPKILSACLWTTRWVTNSMQPYNLYDAVDASGNLNASGTVSGVLGNHLFNTIISASQPAGSLRVYATKNGITNYINVFILNKETKPKTALINFQNFIPQFNYQKWVFTGTTVQDKYPVWRKEGNVSAGHSGISLTLLANSITMLEIRNTGGFN